MEIKDMQDRTPTIWIYTCSLCKMVIARTEVPMDEEGLKNKMRIHKCPRSSEGKQDFEAELR